MSNIISSSNNSRNIILNRKRSQSHSDDNRARSISSLDSMGNHSPEISLKTLDSALVSPMRALELGELKLPNPNSLNTSGIEDSSSSSSRSGSTGNVIGEGFNPNRTSGGIGGSHPEFYTWENLPPQDVTTTCMNAFYKELKGGMIGILCPMTDAEELFHRVYDSAITARRQVSRPPDGNYRLSQLLLMAALGSQHLEEAAHSTSATVDKNLSKLVSLAASSELRTALFTSARWYLDMAFGRERNDLERLRANLLVALYFIFDINTTSAWDYLERAISIARACGLHKQKPSDVTEDSAGTTTRSAAPSFSCGDPRDSWMYWKRIWRSLVFLDGCISVSTGSMPQLSKAVDPVSEDYGQLALDYTGESVALPEPATLDFDLHASLASLGVLMGAITNDVTAPPDIDLDTVTIYSDRLKAWHANLPETLTLSTAVRESYESPRKSSTLLIHCAYLSAITMLTRRMLVDRVALNLAGGTKIGLNSRGRGGVASATSNASANASASANALAEEFSKTCLTAAKQLATVVGMLCADTAENRLTRRCRLIVQSAYTSGIVLSLGLAHHRGRPMLESAFNEGVNLIYVCINTLEHCAAFDSVAERYARILRPILTALRVPELTPAAKRARLYRDPYNDTPVVAEIFPSTEAMIEHILSLVNMPYGGSDSNHTLVMRGNNLMEYYRYMTAPLGGEPNSPPPYLHTSSPPSLLSNSHTQQQHRRAPYPALQAQNIRSAPGLASGSGDTMPGDTSGGNNEQRQLKYPFKSREEYDAFFRRCI